MLNIFKKSRKTYSDVFIQVCPDNFERVSGQLPPRKIVPRSGLRFKLGLGLVLRLAGNFTQGNCPRTV